MIVFCLIIEALKPRFKIKIFNKERIVDSTFLFLNEMIYPIVVASTSYMIGTYFEKILTGYGLVFNLKQYHIAIQYIFLILLLDLLNYSFHYVLHRFNFLWGFHEVHHTTTELMCLSAFRLSWGQNVVQGLFFGSVTGFFIIDNDVRQFCNLLSIFACLFQHLNTRVIFPKVIEHVFITPKNHFWHHSRVRVLPYGQNFGLFFTLWDKVFSTYYNPNHFNSEVGLQDKNKKLNVVKQIFYSY